MMITCAEAAAQLDGSEYLEEGSKDLFAQMAEAGLVAVFGASDDLMEFRGAENDEVGCNDGGSAYFTSSGLLRRQCEDESCPHESQREKYAQEVEAVTGIEDYTFVYRTDIPHVTFEVVEDGEKYCRGIIFALADVV